MRELYNPARWPSLSAHDVSSVKLYHQPQRVSRFLLYSALKRRQFEGCLL
jgi:hypothetical protein